ncbi:MAG: GIY-YIG nuclease family protein [Candidatus Pacebacteria bacterium]|nr:GIY-YIG nuclease family protein [Candidatus Paceibacterota bacterium]
MYYLYILKCADGTLYTGITVDLARRVEEHNFSKLGAKYTKSRRPVELLFSKSFRTRSTATKEEARIKKLSREDKLEIIKKRLFSEDKKDSY